MFRKKNNKGNLADRRKTMRTPDTRRDVVSVFALFLSLWAACVVTILITSKILLPSVTRGGLPSWAQDVERKCREDGSEWKAESDVYAEESFAYIKLDDERRPQEVIQSGGKREKDVASKVDDTEEAIASPEEDHSPDANADSLVKNLHAIDVIGNAGRKSFSPFDIGKG